MMSADKRIIDGEEFLDFVEYDPKDPEVLEAKEQHKNFVSPLGFHIYRGGKYVIEVPRAIYESYKEAGYLWIGFVPDDGGEL